MVDVNKPLHLFEAYGIELEHMIVSRDSLDVLPVSDRVLRHIAGEYVNEAAVGRLAWSNEIVLHIIELKTCGPVETLEGLPGLFRNDVERINRILEPLGGMLMPTGMHPWMDPARETRLWPHEHNIIYHTYDRIFGARGHGWANLQSMHINLPFSGDDEFFRLHTAVRLVLPIIPALAASSPVMEGRATGIRDNRMEVYRHNQKKIPSIAGLIVPDAIRSIDEYHALVLEPMYRDIAPYDPEGILRDDWLNSRGAIARFERNTIEIRVIDIQECPLADIALAYFLTEVVRSLADGKLSGVEEQASMETEALSDIFLGTISHAEDFFLNDHQYLSLFGAGNAGGMTAGGLWGHLLKSTIDPASGWYPVLRTIVTQGSLSSRILRRLGPGFSGDDLKPLYRELCGRLAANELFIS